MRSEYVPVDAGHPLFGLRIARAPMAIGAEASCCLRLSEWKVLASLLLEAGRSLSFLNAAVDELPEESREAISARLASTLMAYIGDYSAFRRSAEVCVAALVQCAPGIHLNGQVDCTRWLASIALQAAGAKDLLHSWNGHRCSYPAWFAGIRYDPALEWGHVDIMLAVIGEHLPQSRLLEPNMPVE